MKLRVVVLIAVLFSPIFVAATDTGIYVGGSVGEEISFISSVYGQGADVDGRSFKLFGGVDIGEYFAVELAYHDLGDRNCCWYGAADYDARIKLDGYSASVLAKLPVSRFDLFAKVGYLFWDQGGSVFGIEGERYPYSDDGSDFMAGVGVEFNLTDHFAVRAEWEYINIDNELFYMDDHDDTFSLGVRYTF